MSETKPSPPSSVNRPLLRRIFRLRFPQIVVVATVLLYFGSMIEAGHHIERQWFNLSRSVLVLFAGTLLGIWAIFFSGWRKLPVAVGLVVLVGAGWRVFDVENDGHLNPTIHARYWVLH